MEKMRVCVTGAGGFVASWLIKLLLSKGYIVHGTVRDPGDDKKYAHLNKLDGAPDNLKLFKADLLDYDSVRSAIEGCTGVFHLACPIPTSTLVNPEIEMLEPAVKGTLNVLRASSEAKVKRVVCVSSIMDSIIMETPLHTTTIIMETPHTPLHTTTINNFVGTTRAIPDREHYGMVGFELLFACQGVRGGCCTYRHQLTLRLSRRPSIDALFDQKMHHLE